MISIKALATILTTTIIGLLLLAAPVAVADILGEEDCPAWLGPDAVNLCKEAEGEEGEGGGEGGSAVMEAATEFIIENVVRNFLFVIGAASVIVIIVAGIKYVTSVGDPSKTAAAKTTIIYAIIGLFVAIAAIAIIDFAIAPFIGRGE